MTTLAPAAAAPTRLLSRARFARHRATTAPARVVVRPRAATSQQPFWDNGPAPEDDGGPAHRGFTPVPGFGEYYRPPPPRGRNRRTAHRDPRPVVAVSS